MESGRDSYILAVYRIQRDSGDITLMDKLKLGTGEWPLYVCPRVDRHSRRVFIPCSGSGVTVAHLDGDRLAREKILTCVGAPMCVDVMSPDTVYVGGGSSGSVHVVDVRDDRITMTLEKPDTVSDKWPRSLAVLGKSVMVSYGDYPDATLVVYRHDGASPVSVIPQPEGLKAVTAVTTDCHSKFLVTDSQTKSVFVMDVRRNIRHKLNIDTNRDIVDCVVVNRQLWVGCHNGDIVIMSGQ